MYELYLHEAEGDILMGSVGTLPKIQAFVEQEAEKLFKQGKEKVYFYCTDAEGNRPVSWIMGKTE